MSEKYPIGNSQQVERLLDSIVNETRKQERYIESSRAAEHMDEEVYKSTVARHQTIMDNSKAAIINLVLKEEKTLGLALLDSRLLEKKLKDIKAELKRLAEL